MQLVWRALLSPHLPRCETKDTPCHAQDKPLGTGTHNFSNSLFRPQELSWKCRSRLVWQGVNNYTRGGMTHLNSIIQISYSCRNIIELLRGCYTHCRKGGRGATKEKKMQRNYLAWWAGSKDQRGSVWVGHWPALTMSSAPPPPTLHRENREIPLYCSWKWGSPLTSYTVCLKNTNASPESFRRQNVPSTYYVLASGMQREDKIPPPKQISQ